MSATDRNDEAHQALRKLASSAVPVERAERIADRRARLLPALSAFADVQMEKAARRPVFRRTVWVAAAVLLAAIVAGLRHASLPFTGTPAPKGIGITGSEDPFAVALALWRTLLAHPPLGMEALALAAAAVALPYARKRGIWAITGLGAGLIAVTLLPAPSVAAAPLVVTAWATCTVLALRTRS